MPSAWESDRLTLECVVCGDPAEKRVELPRLPDVHVAFAGGALCIVCESAAIANDSVSLAARAGARWDGDPDVVEALVRLVLAWAGHSAAPASQNERADPVPLSGDDLLVWQRLEPLIYRSSAADPVIRGRIESSDSDLPVAVVVRAGQGYRLDDESGVPRMIGDGVTSWFAWEGTAGMAARPYSEPTGGPGAIALAFHRQKVDDALFGFGTPIGPIVAEQYLARPAYRFAFAAPPHKPADMQVVVDAETGLMLEQRFGDWSVSRWTRIEIGGEVDASSFVWHGPVIDEAAIRAEQEREAEEIRRRNSDWFAREVTPRELKLDGAPVALTVHRFEHDGSFEAMLDGTGAELGATLARRLRSDEHWNLRWYEVTHRWSDERWDWALQFWRDGHSATLSEAEIADLRTQLGS